MNPIAQPTILIIAGISGDLAGRYLLPSIERIQKAGMLPKEFCIVGLTRRPLAVEDVLPAGASDFLKRTLTLRQMDLADVAAYRELDEYLSGLEAKFSAPAQRLFYLSLPPHAVQPVIHILGDSGLSQHPHTKLLLEKPFGIDLTSAEELIEDTRRYFAEEQIYRIDHYLAKEMAQNIVAFRSANPLFKYTWNREFIDKIEIIASEKIGIEGRKVFYEQTGALRDLVQGHLLQLAALVLMDLPPINDWQEVPKHRLRALQQLRPPADVAEQVVRGQYQGYRNEVGNPGSNVETFVSLTLYSDDPRWENVPIHVVTGKSLERRTTEICIHYKQAPADRANTLVLRIQPNEGVEIGLWLKQPGFGQELRQLPLNFSYSSHYSELPGAYERVFVDAMASDHRLFAASEEVLASWQVLEPVQKAWDMSDNADLISYPVGSSIHAIQDVSDTPARTDV